MLLYKYREDKEVRRTKQGTIPFYHNDIELIDRYLENVVISVSE